MKDYYGTFLETKNSENVSESQVSKVSKGHIFDEKQAFDTFDTSLTQANPKIYFPKNNAELGENVFDSENETGTKVIQYLYDCGEKYKAENRTLFVHNQPTVEAYEAELSLVDGIRQREAGNISSEALKTILDHYILTHSPDADISPKNWTGKDVPLVYFKILLNGEQLEAYTCNKIQSQILGAMWQRIHPEAGFSVMPL